MGKEKFRCSDGNIFSSKEKAKYWEETLKIAEKIKHIPVKNIGGLTFGIKSVPKIGKAYFLTKKEEFELVMAYQNRTDGCLGPDGVRGNWRSESFKENDWHIFRWEENNTGGSDYYWVEIYSEQLEELKYYMSHYE